MLVPYNWLKEYVAFEFSADQLAEKLTMAGLEVETVVRRGKDISSVVVGAIDSVKPHPNADRLVLCQVDVADRSLQIVCGATNMAAGALAGVVGYQIWRRLAGRGGRESR